ncbi:hypothetical protein SCAR479_06034 [Seiridium cardinale]|uniref:Uncharacterized protein n=1 Tax=Seiridium cardinale TaxID=138064 RepID=A0ABR2XUD6_9PEZI
MGGITGPPVEARNAKVDAGNLAKDGLTATDRYGTALMEFNTKVEARLRLKIDFVVVPLVPLMFLFCFIDRANIGNARLAGVEKDLGMKANDFNAANSLGWYLPVVTMAFGLTSIGIAYVHNFSELAGVRFLLGIFEAGVMPGITYYVLSRWYRRAELTFRISLWVPNTDVAMAPLAGAFGGLLASGILNVRGFGGIPDGSWRLIFVIEGLITVSIDFVSLFLLTDRPETARWLSTDEKNLAVARGKSERVAVTQSLDKPDSKKL